MTTNESGFMISNWNENVERKGVERKLFSKADPS